MHERAQYIDGKLIDEKGQFVDNKPKLHPPPTPVIIEEVKVKRKNISISIKTWEDWKEIKGTKKWDTVLSEALALFNKVKNLEDIITRIALQKATIIQSGVINQGVPARIPRAIMRPTPPDRKKALPFLDEIKKIVKNLEDAENGILSYLTPLETINQEDIQLSEEVLEQKMIEADERSFELRKRKQEEEKNE